MLQLNCRSHQEISIASQLHCGTRDVSTIRMMAAVKGGTEKHFAQVSQQQRRGKKCSPGWQLLNSLSAGDKGL